MTIAYNSFKFLHIAAAMIWLGGLVAVNILNARLARSTDSTVLETIVGQNRFFGTRVVGPAAGITLIAGIIMLLVSDLGMPVWVIWGLIAIFVSMGPGATLLRRTGEDLIGRVAAAGHGDPRVEYLQRRLRMLNIINLLLLFSAVWAMVFKPTL